VLKETRRPAHSLTSVVDDVIEARQALEKESREQLHARCVPQIYPVDFQELTSLLLRKARQVRAIGFDSAKHTHAG
jgi:hypothetical protein